MTEMLSPLFPDLSATVAIEIIPLEKEKDNLNTLALAQQIQVSIWQDFEHLQGIRVSTVPSNGRSIDVIVLLTLITASIVTSKDLLTSIFNMVTMVLELLAKKDHIQEIEIIADGRTLIIRDLKKKTAQELIEALAIPPTQISTVSTSKVPVIIKARVSKKRQSKRH